MQRVRRWYAWWKRHLPRLRDVLFIVLSLLYLTLAAGDVSEDGWGVRAWSALSVGLVTCGVLWWRRRFPVLVAVLTILGHLWVQVAPPMLFALFTVAIRRRDSDSVLALLSLAAYASFVLPWALREPGSLLSLLLTGPFVIGSFVAAGAYVGARRDLLDSWRDRAERAEAERELRAEQARLGERARIAQEMHDVLAHKVSLIALHAGGLEVNPTMPAARIEGSAGLIRETARQAMEDLRQVLGVLRADLSATGADLAPVPTASDLDRLVAASRNAGVSVHAELALPDDLPDPLSRTVYRIVQESLTNVHKHARGAATDVLVVGAAGHGVTVRVTNVRPVAADSLLPGSGAGLVGLRERIGLVDGTLAAGPAEDGGWRVEAWLPWDSEQEGQE